MEELGQRRATLTESQRISAEHAALQVGKSSETPQGIRMQSFMQERREAQPFLDRAQLAPPRLTSEQSLAQFTRALPITSQRPPEYIPPSPRVAVSIAHTAGQIRANPGDPPVPKMTSDQLLRASHERAITGRTNQVLEQASPGPQSALGMMKVGVQQRESQIAEQRARCGAELNHIRSENAAITADIAGIDAQLNVERRPARIQELQAQQVKSASMLQANKTRTQTITQHAQKEIARLQQEINAIKAQAFQQIALQKQKTQERATDLAREKRPVADSTNDEIADRLGLGTRADNLVHLAEAMVYDFVGTTFDRENSIPSSNLTKEDRVSLGLPDDGGLGIAMQAMDGQMKNLTDRRRTLTQLYIDLGDERYNDRLKNLEDRYRAHLDVALKIKRQADKLEGSAREKLMAQYPRPNPVNNLPPATPLPYPTAQDHARARIAIAQTKPDERFHVLAQAAERVAKSAANLANEYQWSDLQQSYTTSLDGSAMEQYGSEGMPGTGFELRSRLPAGQSFLDAVENGVRQMPDPNTAYMEMVRKIRGG